MIRRDTSQGVSHSVVDCGGIRRFFVTAAPAQGNNLQEQTLDVLRSVARVVDEQGGGTIVQQAVFVPSALHAATCREIVRDFYGSDWPATTLIPQPPCNGKLVQIEACAIAGLDENVCIDRPSEDFVVARHNGMAWAHLARTTRTTPTGDVCDQSLDTFQRVNQALSSSGISYSQVIRTWLYLGDILGQEGNTLRYDGLNRGRTEFYRHHQFNGRNVPPALARPIYPASTAIGAAGHDLTMGCLALATDRNDVLLAPLENPLQTSAFDYDRHYSPKFSRAMAVVANDAAVFFVSGTSSITAADSRHPNDLEKQIEQTLDNVASLLEEENLCRHGLPGLGATLADLALLRVYLKRQEDYPHARDVCTLRLGELPVIYTIADICRPELLVEVEAVAFARRSKLQ